MAANKKNSNTSKTAHVMDLISKKRDTLSSEETSAGETAAAPQAPKARAEAPASPIISTMVPDAAVSAQIKNALEDALAGELDSQPAEAAAPEPEPVAATPEPEPPVISAPSEPELPAFQEWEPEPVPQEPAAEEPAPSLLLEEPAAQQEHLIPAQAQEHLSNRTTYINVMQVLVEEKVEKYIKMFGLCECDRCVADVKALSLNSLPPKYVVMKEGEMVPRITVYEGQFASAITAQLLRACKAVMEHPRHDM